jgi:hypothetical protein
MLILLEPAWEVDGWKERHSKDALPFGGLVRSS